VLDAVATEVFDEAIDPQLARAYLAEPRYRLVVALDGDTVVGMASGFSYFHPDKAPEFFVNECGVDDAYVRRGIGARLMRALFAEARRMGITLAWLGTETDNVAANALYASLGGKPETMVYYEFDLEGGDEVSDAG